MKKVRKHKGGGGEGKIDRERERKEAKCSLTVSLGEDARRLGGIETDAELGHGMHVLRQAVEKRHDVLRQLRRTLVELDGEGIDLLFRRHLRREEEPD